MTKWLGALLLLGLISSASASDWHYKVRPGDSLWTLCERFAARPNQCRQRLAGHNHLTRPNRVAPGDALSFPIAWLKPGPLSARLTMQRGDVLRYPAAGGPAQPLRDGQPVAAGDAIETGEGAARLRFPDQDEVLIKPRSLLIVQHYPHHPGHPGDTSLRLQHGALYVHRAVPLMEKSRFRVYTPGGTVTVRGSDYDLVVDHRETTRGEVRSGRLEIDAGGRYTTLRAGEGTLVAAGQAAAEPRLLLAAPTLRVRGGRHALKANWSGLPAARGYWLELYALPGRTLLAENRLNGDDWQRRLPPGRYRVQVRAVDEEGLRGRVASASARIGAPSTPPSEPRVAPLTPLATAAPPQQQRSHKKRDLWIFIGAAALVMTL